MFTKNVLTSSIQGAGFELEYLVIAGGGGGGGANGSSSVGGAGGGAGGYRSSVAGEDSGGGSSAESPLVANLGVAYTLTVGAGGAGGASGLSDDGDDGNNSTFASIVSIGGGGGKTGASAGGTDAGRDGGSGGGGGFGSTTDNFGGLGTAGQGFAGGRGENNNDNSGNGGGGGAGAVGQDGVNSPAIYGGGSGGDGVQSTVTGVNIYRAGGGAAPGYSSGVDGSGGLGGGGGPNTAGTANTGGGGGGGKRVTSSGANGGSGGSGVVIIKLPRKIIAEFSAGVSYNYIPVDGFHVYEITAAGVSDTVTFKDGSDIPVTIDESLRFNDNDTAYLDGTYSASATNTKATFAFWYKSGFISASQMLYQARDNNSVNNLRTFLQVAGGTFRVRMYNSAATQVCALNTTRVFRDPSAWYHLVFQFDTTQATASDRIKLYVNGVLNTDFSVATTYPPLNFAFRTVSSVYTDIGRNGGVNTNLIDGYLADYYFIDGQALDPSNFGHADDNGVWQPIAYPGTYGTNGFHLEFADNSTAAALGTDTSGNGNDFTPSGITTDDQVTDTPSNNFATWNAVSIGADSTLSDGNLKIAYGTSLTRNSTTSTFGMQSGKWYWETEITASSAANTTAVIGISLSSSASALPNYPGFNALGWGYDGSAGDKYHNASGAAYGATYGVGDVIGIAFDADTGDLEFYKNNASQGVAYAGLTNGPYFPAIGDGSATNTFTATTNFGQQPFTYTPPTGFVALNSSNLPTPTIADGKGHFDIALYTGTGKARTVRGFEFQPDFVWIKNRDAVLHHVLSDAVRGAQNALFSSTNIVEFNSTINVTAFNSNGFTVGSSTNTNASGQRLVAWNWYAGGSTVTNTDGTITSQVRANTTAGFSIVTYTADGSTSNGVGHGLDETPTVIIYKRRSGAASDWYVWTTVIDGSNDFLLLNTTAAAAAITGYGSPTSTTISNYGYPNTAEIVAYCFHSVDGFSKFGTYTGNGSADGPFVYTGFRPAWVMFKATSVAGESWGIMDSRRLGYNVINSYVQANSTAVEYAYGGGGADILSNGFKLRSTSTGVNGSGITFIYMAFAENPFKTARAR